MDDKIKVKDRRGGPHNMQPNFGQENVLPGDNAKATLFVLALSQFDRVDLSDPVAVQDRIDTFWNLCVEHDTKPLVSGMADVLGLDRRRLWEITHDSPKKPGGLTPETVDLIKKAYRKMEVLWEHYISNGKMNPVSAIFLGKNNFGYADKQEVVVSPQNPLGDYQSAKQLEERIDATIVIDDD